MLLAIDVGNTNITLGLFKDDELVETFRLPSDKELPQSEYEQLLKGLFKNYKITGCSIGSVVNELSSVIKQACDNVFGFESFFLTTKSNHGLKWELATPNELGADRIANAVGAKKLYKLPVIVVDIGTATTFDVITKDGVFIGGVIMPGLNMQFKALNSCTSKLPKIEIGDSPKALGDSTETALLSGVIRGSACAIEGLLEQCEKELGEKAIIVATGGHSSLISKYMNRKFNHVNPSLTLQGLKFAYELSAFCH